MLKWAYGVGAAIMLAIHLTSSRAMAGLLASYAPELTPITLFLDAPLIPKLVMMLCNLLLVGGSLAAFIGLILALVRQAQAARVIALLLGVGGVVAAVLGGLAGTYDYAITQQAMAQSNTTSIAVVAPSYAEALLAVSTGAFAGFVMLTGAFVISLLALWREPKAAPAPAA